MTSKFSFGALVGALALLVVSVVGQPSTGHATTIISTPLAHGFAADNTVPQGGVGDQANALLFLVQDLAAPGSQHRGIVEFNIFGLTPVSSAILRLPITQNGVTFAQNFLVLGYTGDGTIGNADYQIGASSISTFNVTPGQSGVISVDVTSFINAQIALNSPFAGFRVQWNSPPSNDFVSFGGDGSFESTIFPTLDVSNAVPLPAALPLFATGLGTLGLLGWRRKRKSIAA